MQDKFASSRLALDQRTAQLEQVLRRCAFFLGKIPLERWKWLVTLLLVIWLSHSLARLFWLIIPEPAIPPASVSAPLVSTSGTNGGGQSVNIAALKEMHIFGEVDKAAVVEQASVSAPVINENEAADTQLNLELRGVIGSNTEGSARAIIASGAAAEVYAPGDTLPVGNGVTLAKILDLRVILNNNGRFESLWLYKDDPKARAAIATPYVPEVRAVDEDRAWPDERDMASGEQGNGAPPIFMDKSPGADNPNPGGPAPSNDQAAEVSRTLSDVVAMSIHREGGQVVGYKIRPGRNAEQFTALGLQANDIVTAVNGVPLTSPGKVMEIYKNMSNATSASLEIKRGGSVLSVDVVLQ